MSVSRKAIPIWGVVAATLTLGTLVSTILATVMLDAFLEGPGPASVTTRVPGLVYASATVMKVCFATGLAWSVMALVRRVAAGRADQAEDAQHPLMPRFPVWGITSVALAPLTPLSGAATVLMAQTFAHTSRSLSMIDMSQFSRAGVVVALLMISAGAMAAAASLMRRERPLLLSVCGLVTNVLLIGLFWHFEFYAIGFDQDMWAPQ